MAKSLMNFKILSPRSKVIPSLHASGIQEALHSAEKTQESPKGSVDDHQQDSEPVKGKYRLGCLEVHPYRTSLNGDDSSAKNTRRSTIMQTPACLYYCQAANMIPHLLPEVASTLKNSAYQNSESDTRVSGEKDELEAKKIRLDSNAHYTPKIHHTSIDHFINVPGYKELTSFSEFTSTEKNLTLMDVHDPSLRYQARAEAIKPWKSGKEFATLATTNGLFKISPTAYADIISSFKMDMAVCLYDCMPNVATRTSKTGRINQTEPKIEAPNQKRVAKSLERTSKWTEAIALSSSIAGTSLISAVVGGPYAELRARSAQLALAQGDKISGFLVANLHGGEKERLLQLQQTLEVLQADPSSSSKPVFSWEFITPREVLLAVERGVDVFDSTYPYLAAEHGYALTFDSLGASHFNPVAMLNLNRPTSEHVSRFQDDTAPISEKCACYACSNQFSRAYIVHLLNTHEMLANILLMWYVYLDFFESMRHSLHGATFESDKASFDEAYGQVDWFEFLDAELTLPPSQRTNSPMLD